MPPLQKSRSGVAFPLEDQNVKCDVTISHQDRTRQSSTPKALWPRAGSTGPRDTTGCSPQRAQQRARFKGKRTVSGVGLVSSVD